jgi:hypothetical protein
MKKFEELDEVEELRDDVEDTLDMDEFNFLDD